MTIDLDKRLNECARNLNDGKLLALLSGGDVIAQEIEYHKACLTCLKITECCTENIAIVTEENNVVCNTDMPLVDLMRKRIRDFPLCS